MVLSPENIVLVPKKKRSEVGIGDTITFREKNAEFPEVGQVIIVNKRRKEVVAETGIKGRRKNVVKRVSIDRICRIHPRHHVKIICSN
jgi:hypothetical protein